MADTNQNISIPGNTWSNIYALSSIDIGTAISVENVGDCDIFLAVQSSQPAPNHNAYVIIKRGDIPFRNTQGDSGAWAFCQGGPAKLNVRTIV